MIWRGRNKKSGFFVLFSSNFLFLNIVFRGENIVEKR